MKFTAHLPAGDLVIEPVTLPETPVNRLGPLSWLVDKCVGTGKDGKGNQVVINLPEEPANYSPELGCIVARAFSWEGTLVLADGRQGKINVRQPDCPIDLLRVPMLGQAVTAVGFVDFGEAMEQAKSKKDQLVVPRKFKRFFPRCPDRHAAKDRRVALSIACGQVVTPADVKRVVDALIEMADGSWPNLDGWNDWVVEVQWEILDAIREGQIVDQHRCIDQIQRLADYDGQTSCLPER